MFKEDFIKERGILLNKYQNVPLEFMSPPEQQEHMTRALSKCIIIKKKSTKKRKWRQKYFIWKNVNDKATTWVWLKVKSLMGFTQHGKSKLVKSDFYCILGA